VSCQLAFPIYTTNSTRKNIESFIRDDDEKKSLTGHSRAGESETDSMVRGVKGIFEIPRHPTALSIQAEFGEGDPGRFTEDGSFIGQYGPNKTLVVATSTDPKR
jgi:hypothetical protein